MKTLLKKFTIKIFNAFQAYNALNKRILSFREIKMNSLLIGSTKKHCDFLPSKTYQWFSSINN